MTTNALIRLRTVARSPIGVALAVVFAVAVGTAIVRWAVVSSAADKLKRVQCANNLKTIASVVQERLASRRPWPDRERGYDGLLRAIPGVDSTAFACPCDGMAQTGSAFAGSYLLCDLERQPVPRGSMGRFPLLLCLHHGDEVQVYFDDSSVELLDRAALGLAAGDPIETGPESKSELLRVFPPRAR